MENKQSLENELALFVEDQNVDAAKLHGMLSLLDEYIRESGLDKEKLYRDYIHREQSEDWHIENKVHENEDVTVIEEHYATTFMYLIELSIQESKFDYRSLYERITHFSHSKKVRKTFDFGGGIGGLCIHLFENDIPCDYIDIFGNTWNYAAFRFRKSGSNISQYTAETLRNASEKYDMITSTDNFEHLKDLPSYIAFFNRMLCKNGFLLTTCTFRGRGLHLASNYKYDNWDEFMQMMGSKGFALRGQLIKRFGYTFVLPAWILKMMNRNSSGRLLVFQKLNNGNS